MPYQTTSITIISTTPRRHNTAIMAKMERASIACLPNNTAGIASVSFRSSYHFTMISTTYEGEGTAPN